MLTCKCKDGYICDECRKIIADRRIYCDRTYRNAQPLVVQNMKLRFAGIEDYTSYNEEKRLPIWADS